MKTFLFPHCWTLVCTARSARGVYWYATRYAHALAARALRVALANACSVVVSYAAELALILCLFSLVAVSVVFLYLPSRFYNLCSVVLTPKSSFCHNH